MLSRGSVNFKDATLTISRPDVYKWDGVTIEVFGFSKETSEDDLKTVFQNAKKVGGGPVEDVHMYKDCAVVRYKNEEGRNWHPFILNNDISPYLKNFQMLRESLQRVKSNSGASTTS